MITSVGATVDELLAATAALRSVLGKLDVVALLGGDCMRVAADLATTEKACAAVRAQLAARAASTGAPRRAGFADPADWLARQSGTTRRQAQQAIDVGEAVTDLPAVAAAFVAGDLSVDQAEEIARTVAGEAEADRADTEADLLRTARTGSLRQLRDVARRRRLARLDVDALHRRQHAARYVRHWTDELGMVRLDAALPPEVGVPLVNRLDRATDRLRRAAKRSAPPGGAVDRHEAYAADALVGLGAGRASGVGDRADLVIVADLNAYRRGHAHEGEACHIVGGGPIPVEVARRLGRDAFLKAVLHDGVAIHTVRHFGRHIRAELRTALDLGPVPEFDGVTCLVAGCDRRHHLEWDHRQPLAAGGATTFANLDPRCWPHHREKSEAEQAAGLYRGLGRAGSGGRPP